MGRRRRQRKSSTAASAAGVDTLAGVAARTGSGGAPSNPLGTLGHALNRALNTDDAGALAAHSDWLVRRTVAWRTDLDPRTLERLARDPNPNVRRAVATHPGINHRISTRLAGDPDTAVVRGLAGNPATSPGALTRLAGHTDDIVRLHVADNPATIDRARASLVVAVHREARSTPNRLGADTVARIDAFWPDEVIDAVEILLANDPTSSDRDILELALATTGHDDTRLPAPQRRRVSAPA
jgi:hypothetical protein